MKWWDNEETVLAIRAVRNKERAIPSSLEGLSSFYAVEHSVTNENEILPIYPKRCEKTSSSIACFEYKPQFFLSR